MGVSITNAHGPLVVTHNAVIASSTVVVDCRGYNAVELFHTVTSGTAYARVQLLRDNNKANTLGNHPITADGPWVANVKTANQTASYISVFKGITPYIGVALNRSGGTHTVRALPVNV